MKRKLICIGSCLILLVAASLAVAKDRKGPITGTWDCQAHGGSQGDMAVTLYLEQNKESVDGSISSTIGATQISSGTFKRNMLEIHIDTPQGPYVLMGKFNKGTLSGTWSSDTEKGTWEGNKQVAARK
ncbi:MAG: hypothetical protein ABSG32_02250 [Terriglobia bacterium]|jgi:hypothetical protein